MNAGPYILVWSSGHRPPVPVYYTECAGEFGGKWTGGFDRTQAKRFPTIAAAKAAWDATHQWPEDYQACWLDGSVRAETCEAPELCLA